MDGQWQQLNTDVHTEIDFTIHGDECDGLLRVGANTNLGNNVDATVAAAEQYNNGGETHSDQRMAERSHNRKRYNRDQLLQLEAAFQENTHLDEKQRADLGQRIGISAPQVKNWFKNRRSSQKTQDKRQKLNELRAVNEALQAERQALRSATKNNTCLTCGGPTIRAGEQQHLLCENVRLKDELRRAKDFLPRVSGRRSEAIPVAMPLALSHSHNIAASKALETNQAPSHGALTGRMIPANEGFAHSQPDTKNMLIGIATCAREEFMNLAYIGTPMWMPTPDGELELLNFQNYIDTMFPSLFGPFRMGSFMDGTRKAGNVLCTADNLIAVLMDAANWSETFSGIVVSTSATHIVTPSTLPHEMIILIDAELMVLSPRVPVRKIRFMRQCRKVNHSTWVVVDVSIDEILEQNANTTSRLLPSGCLIEARSSSYCKVTWVVNMEYDETTVSPFYHPILHSGKALGACRWLTSLQRRCEYLAILHSPGYTYGIILNRRKNILEVAQQMTRMLYEAVCAPRSQPWRSAVEWRGGCGIGIEKFDVLARIVTFTVGNGAPIEEAGVVVLKATTSVWLPGIPPQQLFNYLCDGSRRGEWDNLANGAPVLEEGYFPTGLLPGNAVSVLRTIASERTNGKLILQEACTDTSCKVLAYASVDDQSMKHAINNGGPASLSYLPSGMVILPDGASLVSAPCSSSTSQQRYCCLMRRQQLVD